MNSVRTSENLLPDVGSMLELETRREFVFIVEDLIPIPEVQKYFFLFGAFVKAGDRGGRRIKSSDDENVALSDRLILDASGTQLLVCFHSFDAYPSGFHFDKQLLRGKKWYKIEKIAELPPFTTIEVTPALEGVSITNKDKGLNEAETGAVRVGEFLVHAGRIAEEFARIARQRARIGFIEKILLRDPIKQQFEELHASFLGIRVSTRPIPYSHFSFYSIMNELNDVGRSLFRRHSHVWGSLEPSIWRVEEEEIISTLLRKSFGQEIPSHIDSFYKCRLFAKRINWDSVENTLVYYSPKNNETAEQKCERFPVMLFQRG